MPKSEKLSGFKKAYWIIISVIIVGSFVFPDYLFSELSWSARILLVVIGIVLIFSGNERVPSTFELRFYDDHLVLYREKHYYSKKVQKKEYNKFYYKDIEKIEYRKNTELIQFEGTVEMKWYDYNKDGSLPDKPTFHRTAKGGIIYFYKTEQPDIDFVSIIEKYTPIKVQIVD